MYHSNKLTPAIQYALLFFIVLLALVLRLYNLTFQSMWYDELHSIIPTNPENTLLSIIEYSKKDQPPAYFILLHQWFSLTGYNEYYGKLLSVIIGLGGVVAMFFLGKEFKDSATGLFASFITAINYLHIYFSQEVRFYTMLFLLSILSYLFFIKCCKKPLAANYAGYTLFSILLIYTHYYGMVVLLTQLVTFICLILLGKRDTTFIVYAIISGLLIIISFIPWLPTVFTDNQISSFWIEKPKIYFIVEYVYVYLGGDVFLGIVYLVLTGLFIRYLVNYFKQYQLGNIQADMFSYMVFILFSWVVISYLIPYIRYLLSTPVMHVRYTLITLPALLMVFALGWRTISRQNIRLIVIGLIAVSSAINLLYVKDYYHTVTRMQFRELSHDLIKEKADSAKVYSDAAWYFNYYLKHYKAGFVAYDTYGRNFENELANEQAIWILYSGALEGATPEQMKYIHTYYKPSKKIQYFQVEGVLYERKN